MAAERTQQDVSRPRPALLAHQWFERQVASHPDDIAVEHGDQRLTYAQLGHRADAVARALAGAGVSAGAFVGIAAQRSAGMLAAVLGTLQAGAAYVPLDLSHPADRIAMILQDTAAPVILTDAASRGLLPPSPATLIDLARLPRGLPGGTASSGATADSVAYVTYTSGSTGRPKGILMPHRAVSNLVAWQLDHYQPWPAGYRTVQFASLAFDVSFQEIFSTFASGGTLVLITEAERRAVHLLASLLNRKRIQRLFIPAVALQQVAEGHREGTPAPGALETVISGSEQLIISADLRRLFAELPRCRLHNEYGPSETHVTTAYHLPADPANWPVRVPIGRPIANTWVHLLDADRRPVDHGAHGAHGEVFIGGAGLADGYLSLPTQTAAAFVPDPFSERPGARLYRTGDIARYLPDGELEFLGRADNQVKIRGYRIELGEIEANLAAVPGIRSAFVKMDGVEAARRRLIAYVACEDAADLGPAELRDYLGRKLPEYMVPAVYVFLDRFPLSVNGKIDQSRLPDPSLENSRRTPRHAGPRDDVERELTAQVATMLSRGSVGRHDDFFAAGGYWLAAARLVASVRQRFRVELTLTDFCQRPTVAGLADHVRRARREVS